MPFDRLISRVFSGLVDLEHYKPLFIQAGRTLCPDAPEWVRVFDYRDRQEIKSLLSESIFCITHGGTGSIIGALEAGCKVAVMPRLKAYSEHNDDHQVEIAELFEESGLVVYWRESMGMHEVWERLKALEPNTYQSEFESLRASVAGDIEKFCGRKLFP
jgi:UDP-N-acetylglucosamine transferase subunit ALG13